MDHGTFDQVLLVGFDQKIDGTLTNPATTTGSTNADPVWIDSKCVGISMDMHDSINKVLLTSWSLNFGSKSVFTVENDAIQI